MVFSLNNLFEWTSRNLSVYPFRIHGISFRQLLFNENKKKSKGRHTAGSLRHTAPSYNGLILTLYYYTVIY